MDIFDRAVLLVILIVGIIGLYAVHNSFRENRMYIQNGYTQMVFPGRSEPVWIKEK